MYERDPNMAPDTEFTPGELSLLCVGNEGRMLDPRRTPIRVIDMHPRIGMFELEVTAFEDRGARWLVPFEDVGKFQFAKAAGRADTSTLVRYEDAVARFDRTMTVAVDKDVAAITTARIAEQTEDAAAWLEEHSAFFGEGGVLPIDQLEGDPLLHDDLIRYLESRGVADIEDAVTETYVSNPHSGEVIKGHRIVLAELGLVPYRGKTVRDQKTFDGAWSRRRRADHIVARLGFVRACFARAGLRRAVLYRSLSFEDVSRGRNDGTFVSSTFSRKLAESWLDTDGSRFSVIMMRQPVPIERVFMTYLETAAMNRRFKEAEAVLLADEANPLF